MAFRSSLIRHTYLGESGSLGELLTGQWQWKRSEMSDRPGGANLSNLKGNRLPRKWRGDTLLCATQCVVRQRTGPISITNQNLWASSTGKSRKWQHLSWRILLKLLEHSFTNATSGRIQGAFWTAVAFINKIYCLSNNKSRLPDLLKPSSNN